MEKQDFKRKNTKCLDDAKLSLPSIESITNTTTSNCTDNAPNRQTERLKLACMSTLLINYFYNDWWGRRDGPHWPPDLPLRFVQHNFARPRGNHKVFISCNVKGDLLC